MSRRANNCAIFVAPQGIGNGWGDAGGERAEHFLTSVTANAASQPAGVNGGQATINVPARTISTVVFTL